MEKRINRDQLNFITVFPYFVLIVINEPERKVSIPC